MLLADQGAEVIKVENPGAGGDHTRLGANRRGGFSASFLNNNRGKRSVALDLKDPAAVEALLRVAAGAMRWATSRATMSAVPAGAKGTTMRTGRSG